MGRLSSKIAGVAVCTLVAAAVRGQEPERDFAADFAAARAQVVPDLIEFADWCGSMKLYAERDLAYVALLRFDADNEVAHRALKHSRQRDGTWSEPSKRPESRNYNTTRLEECAEKRAELVAKFCDRGMAVIAAHADDAPADALRGLLEDALAIAPEDVATRDLCGEVRRDDQWVLKDTIAAQERRTQLKELVTTAVAAVPAPTGLDPAPHETKLDIAWTATVATPKVRVLSSGSLDEAERVAVTCEAAAAVFRSVTRAKSDLPKGFTVYLLVTPTSRDAFIGNWPGWSAEDRARLKTWAGAGVPGDVHHARWDVDARRRLDGAVRHVLGLLTLMNFGYDHQQCAWAWEGVGLYLTRELVGTRFTWYSTAPASGDAEAKELLGKLLMTDVNWMNECYQRAKRGKVPTLATLCTRKIDQFGVDEMLTSYALAAYLIEGRAAQVGDVLGRIARHGSAAALTGALHSDLPTLDATLVRWLGERK